MKDQFDLELLDESALRLLIKQAKNELERREKPKFDAKEALSVLEFELKRHRKKRKEPVFNPFA